MKNLIAPSLLSANFAELKKDCEMLNRSEADWFHIDIMDGMFVPNISFGFPVMKAIKRYAQKPLDVHLMIEAPDRYIKDFVDAGADIICVHAEACPHLHRSIQNIKSFGIKAGVALNPHTPIQIVENVLEDLDMVLIMSVNPGFGGQKFIPNTYKKIQQLREVAKNTNPELIIEIDGGVDSENAKSLYDSGANVLVAGSAVFGSDNPEKTIKEIKQLV
ncbi:MAG: ribulose-phosphate 3-epimerase [Bacteroidales bacterium]